MTQGSTATKGDVLVLVGTRKGLLYCPASEVYYVSYDPRNGGTVFAAVKQMIWGPTVQRSHDLGAAWLSP